MKAVPKLTPDLAIDQLSRFYNKYGSILCTKLMIRYGYHIRNLEIYSFIRNMDYQTLKRFFDEAST